MSNITLYYIPGISDTDTPVFSIKQYQTEFFSRYATQLTDDAFYVPKFKDTIVFSMTDLGFSTSVNYLSIYFNQKYFYYFIDSLDYVSETDVRVSIRMDVIQTYMFDTIIRHGEIIRKTITRVVNGKINRNYIRENLSDGVFRLTKVKMYNKPGDFFNVFNQTDPYLKESDITGTIVFKIADSPLSGDTGQEASYSAEDTPKAYQSAYTYYFLPIVNGHMPANASGVTPWVYADKFGHETDFAVDVLKSYEYGIKNFVNIIDVYYMPMSPIPNLGSRSNVVKTVYYEPSALSIVKPQAAQVGFFQGTVSYSAPRVDILTFEDKMTFDFSAPTTSGQAFSYLHCPALFDENYIRVSFGEGATNASCPLHQLDEFTIKLKYIPSVLDGTRIYNISGSYNIDYIKGSGVGYSYTDPFECAVSAQSVAHMDIIQDEYRRYLEYNKGALIGAFVQTIGGAFMASAVGNARQSAIEDYGIGREVWSGSKKESALNYITTSYRSREAKIQQGREMASSGSGLISWAQGALNASLMPDNPKQVGNVHADRLDNAVTISYKEYWVEDFEEVAKRYEGSGYRVHDEIHNVTIKDSVPHNRYMYDVAMYDNLNIDLVNIPTDETTVGYISDRLKSGIRFWHTVYDSEAGLVKLTAEYESLRIGELFVKDNFDL